METNILITILLRVLEWVISFFKRIRNVCVPKKAVGTENNNAIINITMINPIIINQARRQILGGQSRGGGRK